MYNPSLVSDNKVIVMTGSEVHSISSHSVCKIPVISAAHTPSWAYCTCQITSVHLSLCGLCSCCLPLSVFLSFLFSLLLSLSIVISLSFYHRHTFKNKAKQRQFLKQICEQAHAWTSCSNTTKIT